MERKRKKCEKLKNILLFHHFTLEIFNRGVFLPITKTPKYSTTVLNLVNDTQDFMCIEYKAFLPCKQHPTAANTMNETTHGHQKSNHPMSFAWSLQLLNGLCGTLLNSFVLYMGYVERQTFIRPVNAMIWYMSYLFKFCKYQIFNFALN